MHNDVNNMQDDPNTSVYLQNQINEYNKNQPPPRKQNTACDACRARKVKCNRLPGQEKCQHCLTKNYPCTHHIQQATSEKKRNASVVRRPRNSSSAGVTKFTVLDPSNAVLGRSPSIMDNGGAMAPPPIPTSQNIPLEVKYGFRPHITLATPTTELLSYIFAPPEQTEETYTFPSVPGRRHSLYDAWGDQAFRLEDDRFKAEFTLDLVEVFFQIVHTRIPLLNPAHFRERLQLVSSNGKEPLHPALVATVLAWGSKFSEHPLLVADRRRPGHQSLLAKTLIDRARDLAEALKVHRIPKTEHVINHKSTLASITDAESRATMVFAWWMACFCDAYASAYYRRKPVLDDEDYDIDFYTGDPVIAGNLDPQGGPLQSPREQLEGYYAAAHSLARTARSMSRQLWKPVTDAEGIPLETIHTFTVALSTWRDKFLSTVGVPSNFKGEWDFVSAVSSCASDATYHVMWIILFNALDDFGVKEINNRTLEPKHPRVEEVKRKVLEEALHGALRISGLRLDPAVMHVSCIQAGTFLARMGNDGVRACIAGLKQYSYSYEEAGEQAAEMQRVYDAALAGEPQFSNMGAAVPSRTSPEGLSGDDQDMDMQDTRPHAPWSR
ncbi:hypothetical protein H0H93_015526 [Arthromyces matolae]|nr:hypothetical protein H0H93_015526 [Arthromyces matolae]